MGAAAGDFTGTKPDAEAGRYRRLNDYRMEHIMLGGAEAAGSGAPLPDFPAGDNRFNLQSDIRLMTTTVCGPRCAGRRLSSFCWSAAGRRRAMLFLP